MNNEFETMKTELNKKIEIFKKEADKYDGRLVYTITAVRVTYNRDHNYVDVEEPEKAQKCFSDFSSALKISGCLFYCSLDELEEKTAEKFSNLGKSESGTFAISDFYAQSLSGDSCQVILFVSDADKAEKAAEDDGVSYTEYLESLTDFSDFSKKTKESFYDFCAKAEKVERALTEKCVHGLCFVENAVNISAVTEEDEMDDAEADMENFEEAVFSNIVPLTFCTPYFTDSKAAIKNMLSDILASICPVEADPTRVQFFGAIDTSDEEINSVSEELRKGNSVPVLGFIRGDGTSDLEIFRSLSVCYLDK